ncbi:MAG: sugar kinase, partial [Bacteroidota bacterium]
MAFERIIIVRDKTPLEALLERFPSRPQARFYLDRSGGDYGSYERAHDQFYRSLQKIKRELRYCLPFKILERKYLDRYVFAKEELIVVLGRDGLVANTAKYINGQPIIGVNPDSNTNDGVLLPDSPKSLYSTVNRVLNNKASFSPIQMAEAKLQDGQRLLAFNDFFIGREGHSSARYKLKFAGQEEIQSSSGIIVSTGAGATGWL